MWRISAFEVEGWRLILRRGLSKIALVMFCDFCDDLGMGQELEGWGKLFQFGSL